MRMSRAPDSSAMRGISLAGETTSEEPTARNTSARAECAYASSSSRVGSGSPKFTTEEMRRPPQRGHAGWPGCTGWVR